MPITVNGIWLIVTAPPINRRIPAEAIAPVTIAQHRHRGVARSSSAPKNRPCCG